jgi:hypothetical protein
MGDPNSSRIVKPAISSLQMTLLTIASEKFCNQTSKFMHLRRVLKNRGRCSSTGARPGDEELLRTLRSGMILCSVDYGEGEIRSTPQKPPIRQVKPLLGRSGNDKSPVSLYCGASTAVRRRSSSWLSTKSVYDVFCCYAGSVSRATGQVTLT